MSDRIVGILCGGNGTRLWPLSREKFPKQFHDLAGTGQPLLIDTVNRIEALSPSLFIITGEAHRTNTHTVLSRFQKTATVIGEPVGRDTAAAVALLTLLALRQNPDAIVGSFHSDHFIKDEEEFRRVADAAFDLAKKHQTVVTIAIDPTHPSTAYGYLSLEEDPLIAPGKKVRRFIEKPDVETATNLIAGGNIGWNAGIFVFPARVMAHHFERLTPELWQKMQTLTDDLANLADVFPTLPKIAIDYAIMEKLTDILCLPFKGGWSDIGSWEDVSLFRGENTDTIEIDGKQNTAITFIPHPKKTVFIGLDDVITVDTPDALLVMKRGSGQSLKKAVQELQKINAPELKEHTFEERPWGRFEVLLDAPHFKSKRMLLLPGKKISYQCHGYRTEHWTITRGIGLVRLNDVEQKVGPGDHVTIPAGTKHRIGNPGSTPLEFIEVQTGSYFGEDDIERFEDDFGRK